MESEARGETVVEKTWSLSRLRSELLQVLRSEATERERANKVVGGWGSLPTDAPNAAELAMALMDLAKLDGARGALRALDGDSGGWKQLEKSGLWKALELRVLTLLWERDTRAARRPRSNARDLAIATLHLLAFERREAVWCAGQLRASLDGGAFGVTRTYALSTFALWLAETAEERAAVAPESLEQSVYAGIFESWGSDAGLSDAIERMCAYHMRRTIDRSDAELWVEFEFPPYPVFPVEYLALSVARRRCDMPTPKPRNPLLATPLAEPPVEANAGESLGWDWLDGVLQAMC